MISSLFIMSADRVFATKYMEEYKLVNFKRGDEEHVAVYKGDTLIKDYIQRNTTGSTLQHKCNFTMFSDTHWFFLNPFHTVIECYSPSQGHVYSSLAQGQVSEVNGSHYKDSVGWYNGAAITMAARLTGGYCGADV